MLTIERLKVPAPKRLPCHTIPIYEWMIANTKGEPASPEMLEVAIIPALTRFPFTPRDSFSDLLTAKSQELCDSNSID